MKKTTIILLLTIGFFSSTSFAQTFTNGRSTSKTPSISLVNNHPNVFIPKTVIGTEESSFTKQLISDDLFVIGKLGFGLDMVDNTTIPLTSMIIMENAIRLFFDDTSTELGFPANDWAIQFNDTDADGANYFGVEDVTADNMPFKVMAGAGENALFVSEFGNVGIGNASPSVKLQITDGDTPTVRLDQDNTLGWSAQIWDVAGNEANFFIRDVSSSNKLPFRIATGSPTSSLTIQQTGFVGVGTWAPTSKLDVKGTIRTDSTMLFNPLFIIPAGEEGEVYMDGNDHNLKIHNGTEWITIDNDSQDLVAATLTGTILQIDIENGASVNVDLQPLVQDLEDRIAALEALVSGKESVKYSSAKIYQNAPNPFHNQTTISYYIPENIENAVLQITGVNGAEVKSIPIYQRGDGSLIIDDSSKGTYFYTLVLDGQKLAAKTMVKID